MESGVLTEIQAELESFFHGLNWTYIFIYTAVLHGIANKDEFKWFNRLMIKWNTGDFKVWIAGFVVMAFFAFFRGMNTGLDSEYFSQMFRSWILVVVFNSVFSKKLSDLEKKELSEKKKEGS